MKKIVVIGSLNIDYSISINRQPQVGETIKANSYTLNAGGKGANQAYTIGKLGGNVSFIGAVGDDDNGKFLKKSLENVNVDISHIETKTNTNTGTAFINIDNSGNNSIIIIAGANRISR